MVSGNEVIIALSILVLSGVLHHVCPQAYERKGEEEVVPGLELSKKKEQKLKEEKPKEDKPKKQVGHPRIAAKPGLYAYLL